jgi:hypothetical protein
MRRIAVGRRYVPVSADGLLAVFLRVSRPGVRRAKAKLHAMQLTLHIQFTGFFII